MRNGKAALTGERSNSERETLLSVNESRVGRGIADLFNNFQCAEAVIPANCRDGDGAGRERHRAREREREREEARGWGGVSDEGGGG